jgi:hypothetical protein
MNIIGVKVGSQQEIMKAFDTKDPFENFKKQNNLPTDADKKAHHCSLHGLSTGKFLQTYPSSRFSYFSPDKRQEVLKAILGNIEKAESNHLAANAPARQMARLQKEAALKMEEILLENGSILFVLPRKLSKHLPTT